jgi:hypothetical protein
MRATEKLFWMSGEWVLRPKPLRDPSVGQIQFKPPEWQDFVA